MSYLEKLLPEFRKGAKIRKNYWNKCQYIYYKDNNIYTHKNMCINLTANELVTDYWELYHGSEPDWQYIIDHKCLCWFWNNHHSADDEEIGFLHFVDERIEKKFNTLYKYCRPVRRDEVTFYEDKKDD